MRKLYLLLSWLIIFASPAFAQSPDAQKIYTKLYCPLCGGVRLDACELKVCDEMKTEIQQRLAAGQSEQEIIGYYRARWGDQVLGYPPAEGINWLPWVAPLLLVLVGGIILWRMALTWTRARAASPRQVANSASVPADIAARIERELNE